MDKSGFALFLIMLVFFVVGCLLWVWSDETMNGPLGLQLEVAAYLFWVLAFVVGIYNTFANKNNQS